MPNPFDRMAARMDAATIKKMGKTALINGITYDVIPAELLEEMGPLSGNLRSLVIFSGEYTPRRNDEVVWEGKNWTVTRHELFNGKPRIFIE
ncbi:DNA breaking-rejoining protein [Enterobacter hormaechei subsp. xiangfangensis]|uniref:DNA breaking-rejoining protein n=1 Tax=Enterobacter hormaechei TaxID=158836 RepID=UPI0005ECDBFA|nr:DNA breaking-rejoining protein [Enterobacter hormaechei]KJM81861.1 DNA breaking-rejoining protein [Enterobacter hormaechei subsp. hoffmannii]MBT1808215.1 DNA breaking-rejoining protein [Enterobacter hormaechei subsp. xiangfangensis]